MMKRRDFVKAGFSAVAGIPASRKVPAFRAARGFSFPLSHQDANAVVLVLGTAQDGGVPQIGCYCPNCERARKEPSMARLKPSLAVLDRKSRTAFLVDASPDISPQFDLVHERMGGEPAAGRNTPHGILLTHAHIGHYTGLMFYGYEGINASGIPVYCTAKMAAFLKENGPWSQLVRLGNIGLRTISPGQETSLTERISFIPVTVPHRDEYSDTVGYIIAGPEKKLLYIPDIRNWETWDRSIRKEVEGVDFALLDGTFFSPQELPGRDLSRIGHPFMTATMDIFAGALKAEKRKISFTHLNHSNLALDPEGAARREIEERGFRLASEAMEIPL
jgi:pyrroloquinoline quinone biosynthesis protein B